MDNKNKNPQQRQVVQLNIESVTGRTFQILVSRKERIIDLKEKIELTEGISMSQQHLVWQSVELNDDKTVEDYMLQDGAKLRLIPAMRGGPINFRRVQVQEQLPPEFLQMLADAEMEQPSRHRPVAMVVVRDGEMLNFFRLLDSEFSFESLSDAKVFDIEENLEEDEEARVRREEEDRMRQKVSALRKRMDSIAVDKTKVDLPKPIPPARKSSIRKIPVSKPAVVNQNSKPLTGDSAAAIPPALQPTTSRPPNDPSVTQTAVNSSQPSMKKLSVPRQTTDAAAGSSHHATLHRTTHVMLHDNQRKSSTFPVQGRIATILPFPMNQSIVRFGGSLPQISSRQALASKSRRLSLPGKDFETKERSDASILNSNKRTSVLPDGSEQLMSDSIGSISSSFKALNSYLMLAETFPGGSRFNQPTSDLSSKGELFCKRIPGKPLASPAPQPVVNKDASSKKVTRCAVCSKKTGLASTYECRCEKSFCAVHRYPEAHQCTYDYKGEGRKELKEANPLIVAPKLPKI